MPFSLAQSFEIDWLAGSIWVWWGLVYLLALLSLPSVLLQRRGRPQAALSWVMILFLMPLVGVVLWWAMGRQHLVRRRRKKRRAAERISHKLSRLQAELPDLPETDWAVLPIKRLPRDESQWTFPPTQQNEVHLLIDAAKVYPAIERLISEARLHLHILFYIWQADAAGTHFRDRLIEKARSGVQVRLLLDAVGSVGVRGNFMTPLREAGADVVFFRPPFFFRRKLDLNFRNHRKLVIADGRTALIGGLNIGDEYKTRWHDTALTLRGPVVNQLQEVFVDDWYFACGDDFSDTRYFGLWDGEQAPADPSECGVVASGPHTEINLTHEALFIAITSAVKRIWLTTPYFIPDATIMTALRTAVFRGVDVRLLLPERGDARVVELASRAYFPALLRSGTRIFLYRDGILHSKTVVLDDDLAFTGSANVDLRSFRLNFELNCFIRNRTLNEQLGDLFEADLGRSREVTLEQIESNSYVRNLIESAAHLLSPLL